MIETIITAFVALAAVILGAYLERRHSTLTERRDLVAKLDAASVNSMEYGDAATQLRTPKSRIDFPDPVRSLSEFRVTAYSNNYEIRTIISALGINSQRMARRNGRRVLSKAWALEDAIIELCEAIHKADKFARGSGGPLGYADVFTSQRIEPYLEDVDRSVKNCLILRANLLDTAKSNYREPHFTRTGEN